MALGRTGERGSLTLILNTTDGEVTVGDANISEFSLDYTMFSMPSGVATLVVDSTTVSGIESDATGALIFSNFDGDGSTMGYVILVTKADRHVLSNNTIMVELYFTIGSRGLFANMENVADEGTSLAMMIKLLDRNQIAYDDRLTPNSVKPQDNQVWRLTEASLIENLNLLTNHSNCPNDYMFWCFDENTAGVRLSSIETERSTSEEKLLMYSPQAVGTGSIGTHKLDEPECTCWTYLNYVPLDASGANIESKTPNFMIDSFDGEGRKDMGSCTSECWTNILNAFGVPNDPTIAAQTFGPKDLVKTFPNNTHKSYAVAPYVRNAMLANYGKVVQTALFNNLGPKLGDVVKFVAKNHNDIGAGGAPDEYYTDEYLVISKRISKDTSVPVGILGNSKDSGITDVVTVLVLVSNHMVHDATSPFYKDVIKVRDKFSEVFANG